MPDDFYCQFEEKFRLSFEIIKSRQSVYLPFIINLATVYPNHEVVDLGCGRGEWLDLMKENNIPAVGVDIDDGMLKRASQIGLNVKQMDFLQFLQTLKNDSLMAITGFHIAEHLPFEKLQLLFKESMRVLKPGGILILETPNPENIRVGACNFYLDPTHIHPLPPELLIFLSNYYGFQRTKILRLQEDEELRNSDRLINLLDVLNGVSPDYSLMAQKHADDSIYSALNPYFDNPYGITIDELCDRYDHKLNLQFKQVNNYLHHHLSKTRDLEQALIDLQNQLKNIQNKSFSARIRKLRQKIKKKLSNIALNFKSKLKKNKNLLKRLKSKIRSYPNKKRKDDTTSQEKLPENMTAKAIEVYTQLKATYNDKLGE